MFWTVPTLHKIWQDYLATQQIFFFLTICPCSPHTTWGGSSSSRTGQGGSPPPLSYRNTSYYSEKSIQKVSASDPGSSAFLSHFWELSISFLGYKYLNSLMRIRIRYPRSCQPGIRDPWSATQHWKKLYHRYHWKTIDENQGTDRLIFFQKCVALRLTKHRPLSLQC
jgi:hypothetical protein